MLKDSGYKENQLKQMEAHLFKPYFLKFSTREVLSFIEAERRLQKLERLAGLRPAIFFKNQKKR
ncbi:hypothetical protein KA001_00135 [Patescibacteria group bacterium]|nr:hypothetical protein [Patescibacteria group bacterium]